MHTKQNEKLVPCIYQHESKWPTWPLNDSSTLLPNVRFHAFCINDVSPFMRRQHRDCTENIYCVKIILWKLYREMYHIIHFMYCEMPSGSGKWKMPHYLHLQITAVKVLVPSQSGLKFRRLQKITSWIFRVHPIFHTNHSVRNLG